METLGLAEILSGLYKANEIGNLCVGTHCGEDRKNEYGTAIFLILRRGAKAALYIRFVFSELLPFIHRQTGLHLLKISPLQAFTAGFPP